MIDMSKSAVPHHANYWVACSTLCRSLLPNTRLIIGEIKDLTEAQFRVRFHDILPQESINDIPSKIDSRRVNFYNKLNKAIGELSKSRNYSSSTDILSVFSVFSNTFPDSSHNRVLIIFSDMLHSTKEFDLEKIPVDSQFTYNILNRLRGTPRLPNLHNVMIYVFGATAPDEVRYRAVKDFWTALIRETGATLVNYSYSYIEVDFKSLKRKM